MADGGTLDTLDVTRYESSLDVPPGVMLEEVRHGNGGH
jgi:hypothetical protein